MKKLVRITAFLFLLAGLFSCKNSADLIEKAEESEGFVTVSIPDVSFGREAFVPDTSAYEDYSFVLSGSYGSEPQKVIKEWGNYKSMTGSEFILRTGVWSFTLTANKVTQKAGSNTEYITPVLSGSVRKDLKDNTETLTFNLNQVEDCELDGYYSITLDFPKSDFWKISAFILDPKTNETLEYNPNITKTSDSVTLSGEIPAGNYKMNVKFVYQSPNHTFASPTKIPVFFVVASDCTTTNPDPVKVTFSQLNMNVPIYYAGSDSEYTLPTSAPTSFSPKNSITLPTPTRSGYVFGGWYTTPDFSAGLKIEKTPVAASDSDIGTMQELALYAKWFKTSSSQFSVVVEDGTKDKGFTFVVSDATKATTKNPDDTYEFYIRNIKTGERYQNWFQNEDVDLYGYKYNFPFVDAGAEYEAWISVNGNNTDGLFVAPTTGLGEKYINGGEPIFTIGDDGIVHGENIPTLDDALYESKRYEFQVWSAQMADYIDGIYDIKSVPNGVVDIDLSSILKKFKLYGKDFVFNPYCWISYNGYRYQMSFGTCVLTCGYEWQNYINNGSSSSEISYITANATDRGIEFRTTVLKGTTITFNITEKSSGITAVREWTKKDDWNACTVVYPFVKAGETYEFETSVTQTDHTLYKADFKITAVGGLGEYKIENKDDYDVELADVLNDNNEVVDRVIQFTKTPVFTKNDNVNIADQAVEYTINKVKVDEYGEWMWGQTSWYSLTTGKYQGKTTLFSNNDGVDKWRSRDSFELNLNGYKYRLFAQTYIQVAGYTDNGQTTFHMNDKKEKVGSWGGEVTKAYVIFGDFDDEGYTKLTGLPGDKITLTLVDAKGTETPVECYGYVVDYGTSIGEPLTTPSYTGGISVFNNWEDRYHSKVTFPHNANAEKWDTSICTIKYGKEEVKYIDFILPNITVTYTATLMDGDTKLGTEKFVVTRENGGKELTTKPEITGKTFIGWYLDEACTELFKSDKYEDVTVYAGWSNDADLVLYQSKDTDGDEIDIAAGYDNYIELSSPVSAGSGYTKLYAELKWEATDGYQASVILMSGDGTEMKQASDTIYFDNKYSTVSGDCLAGAKYPKLNVNTGSYEDVDCVDTATKIQFYIQDSSWQPTSGKVYVKKIWLSSN